ncbi:MAG TPA: hypothetical protein VNR36_11680 [Pseudolysinimonas sp.]|nr:hypothetical protein [Pseudolysinimonas sp.]
MTEPTRRERTRPVELLGLSAVIAVAIGVIAGFSTRSLPVAGIAGGVSFIVTLVVFAMLLLAISPRRDEDDPPAPPAH